MDAFETRVIAVIADDLGIPHAELTPASRFAEDYGLDAFGVTELLLRLGEEFDVSLMDDPDAIATVRDAIDAVRELAPQAG